MVPLVVKNPYLNTWTAGHELPGHNPTFWNRKVKGMTGLVRVNNQTYEFMGYESKDRKMVAKQTGLKVTPTQSIFTLTAGPIELTVNFFTPIDPADLKRLSLPASYIAISARALDKGSYEIQVYVEITGEWASGDPKEIVEWNFTAIDPKIANFDFKMKNPKVLEEANRNLANDFFIITGIIN